MALIGRLPIDPELAQVPMLRGATRKELARLQELGDRVLVDAGVEIVREGERSSEFYLLLSGHAAIERDGARIAELAPGDFFGELAAIDRVPRNATVRMLTSGAVLAFGTLQFATALDDIPALSRHVLLAVVRRQTAS